MSLVAAVSGALTDFVKPQISWVVLAPVIALFSAALAIVLLRAIVRTKPDVVRCGSIAIAPIVKDPSLSKTGVHVVPALTVFQTPPEATAT